MSAPDTTGISNRRFAELATRLAQKSATWAADNLFTSADDEPIRLSALREFLRQVDGLVSAMKAEDGRCD